MRAPTAAAGARATEPKTKGSNSAIHAEATERTGKTRAAPTPPHPTNKRISGAMTENGGKAY